MTTIDSFYFTTLIHTGYIFVVSKCDHTLHLFPKNEDESRHKFTKKCPCDPKINQGFEDPDGDEELKEVTIITHNRMH